MATNNSVNSPLSGTTGTGNFVGSTSPAITTPSLGTLNDTSSQAMLQFIPSAGGNWVTMENLSTPRIMPAGASSNIGITVKSKGDASINLVTASVAASTFQVYSGTGSQHNTLLKFPTSAATTTVTFPDATGTIQLQQSSPTIQTFTTGSGTYTTPAGVKYLVVTMCGGGGGGGGVRVGKGAGGNGGTTTFGSWTAIGGNGAIATNGPNNPSSGAAGGTGGASGAGTQIFRVPGASGGSGIGITSIGITLQGPGGGSILSGGNAWFQGTADVNGLPGMGQGGGGAGAAGSDNSAAGGGGGGEQVEFLITSPSSTYSYAVGAGGTAGAGSATGGTGGSGIIIVMEYYQ